MNVRLAQHSTRDDLSARRSMAGHARSFRPDIEGMRGIAILLVVLYHIGVPGVTGGFVGVDVFFVLSGYLITGLLIKEAENNGRISLLHFYARRIRRLLPASLFMLATVTVLGLFVFSPFEQSEFAQSAWWTSLYASNWWFYRSAIDYFAAAVETNPLLHTWSLAVEEQFYLVWPALLLLAFRRQSRAAVGLTMLAVTLASLAGAVWATSAHNSLAFFSSPLRAWEFSVGGFAALLPAPRASASAFRALLAWCGLIGVVASAAAYSKGTLFPGFAAVLPVVGTALVLTANAGVQERTGKWLLNSSFLQGLGRLSYGWYLWHWPTIIFVQVLAPETGFPGRLLAVMVALAVAEFSYRVVENPIRFHPLLMNRPWYAVALALFLTVGGASAAHVWLRYSWWRGERPDQVAFFRALETWPQVNIDKCQAGRGDAAVRVCVHGDTSAARTIVLFGDSHAAHWHPALNRLAVSQGMRLVSFLRPGCPAADVTVYIVEYRGYYRECDEWRHRALAEIAELRPAVVVMASSMGYLRAAPGASAVRGIKLEDWTEGYRRTFARLEHSGVPVRLIRDTPRPSFDVLNCLSRAVMPAWRTAVARKCEIDRSKALPTEIVEAERQAVSPFAAVTIVDLSDQFCGVTSCEPKIGGTFVYRDDDHMTVAYSASLAGVLGDRLQLR